MRRYTTTSLAAAFAFLAVTTGLEAQDPGPVALGAKVWSGNCVRCHHARPSAERSDVQWVTIVNHMRARANLTRTQARLVTAFLQATNLPEGSVQSRNAAQTAEGEEPAKNEGAESKKKEKKGTTGSGGEVEASDPGNEGIDPGTLERLRSYLSRLLAH